MDKKILKDVIYYLSDKQGFVASVIEKDFHLTRILNRVNEHLSTEQYLFNIQYQSVLSEKKKILNSKFL